MTISLEYESDDLAISLGLDYVVRMDIDFSIHTRTNEVYDIRCFVWKEDYSFLDKEYEEIKFYHLSDRDQNKILNMIDDHLLRVTYN